MIADELVQYLLNRVATAESVVWMWRFIETKKTYILLMSERLGVVDDNAW